MKQKLAYVVMEKNVKYLYNKGHYNSIWNNGRTIDFYLKKNVHSMLMYQEDVGN